jgi:hypothetical protein
VSPASSTPTGISSPDTGRERAQAWLDKNFDWLGAESTVDIRGVYL